MRRVSQMRLERLKLLETQKKQNLIHVFMVAFRVAKMSKLASFGLEKPNDYFFSRKESLEISAKTHMGLLRSHQVLSIRFSSSEKGF